MPVAMGSITAGRSPGGEKITTNSEKSDQERWDASIEDSLRLIPKLDLRIMPTLTIIYILSFLDRVNIGNALLFNLPEDLNLRGQQSNTAIAILFVSYVLFEIPATMIMKNIAPHIFLPSCMFVFGLLMLLQGFVDNFGGLVALRFLMGIAEAGVFPSCFYLMSMWYKRDEAQKRFSFFICGASFAAAFGGLLASAIANMDGIRGYSAWRWIFILEGLLTCVLAFPAFFLVSDFPEDAKWLTPKEKEIVLARQKEDQGESGRDEKIHWSDLSMIFKNWQILISAPLYFAISVSGYGLAFFIPSIIRTYGYSPIQSQLHSVIPWAVTLVYTLLIAYVSDRIRLRFPFIVMGLTLAIAGNVMLQTIQTNRDAQYAGLFLYLMGTISLVSLSVCWFTMNLKGHRQRAIGIPYQVGFGNAAGIIGVFAFPPSSSPHYTLGYSLGIGFMSLAAVLFVAYFIGYSLENRNRTGKDRFML